MNLKRLSISFIISCVGLSCFAQAETAKSLPDRQTEALARSHRLTYLDGDPGDEEARARDIDSIRRVVQNFYYDQFRNTMDPNMPYFLFMSKGSEMTMGIGGGVRMRAYYDWDGAMPSTAFSPYTIPIPENPASPRRFNTTPSGTYLNVRVIGHNSTLGSYGLYIEADFTGYNGRDFTIKKGYAMIRDFTLGYATSTFSDPVAQPVVLDAAGPNNKFSNTNVLIRYLKGFKNRFFIAGSIETPSSAIDVTTQKVKAMSNWLPDAAAFVQYQWANGQHVRLSGIIRSLSYLTVDDNRSHNLAGWGVQLSATGRPESHVTLFGTFNYGKGYAGLGGDLLYGAYDLVPVPGNPRSLYAPGAFGWCGGIQYNFLPNLFASVSASQTRDLPKNGINPDEYKYGMFGCVNVLWSILPRVTVGAEYDRGRRKNFSGVARNAQRFNVSAMFTF